MTMVNSSIQVAIAELQRAAFNIKTSISAMQRNFHDQQTQIQKDIESLKNDFRARERRLLRGDEQYPEAKVQDMMRREMAEIQKQMQAKQHELTDAEIQAKQAVTDREQAAQELLDKTNELTQMVQDPRFS